MTPEQIAELRATKYNATIVFLRKHHEDLMILRVRPDFPRPEHKPGQYCALGLGYWEPRHPECQPEEVKAENENRLARRSYSLSCSILDDQGELLDRSKTDWVEFYIVLVRNTDKPEGPALTPRLFMLKEGDRLAMGEKITGAFTLDPVGANDTVLFLSTGTGEAPHNYMLWELLSKGHQGRILSACCVRYHRDHAYFDIHRELTRRYPNYTYLPLTTRESTDLGHKVYIQDLISSGQLEEHLGEQLDPGHTHVFLCGNPKMIGLPEKDRQTGQRVYPNPVGVVQLLEERGFEVDQPSIKKKGTVHYEEYW